MTPRHFLPQPPAADRTAPVGPAALGQGLRTGVVIMAAIITTKITKS